MAALAAGPGVGRACNNPYLSLSQAGAQPGDVVHWTLANAEAGAEYGDVKIAGRTVQSGSTVTETKPQGSFVMPDLGQRTMRVEVSTVVSHDEEGGPWLANTIIEYRPPPPPPADAPTETPATPGSGAEEEKPTSAPRRSPDTPAGRDRKGRERSRAPRTPVPAPDPVETGAAPVSTTTPATAAPAVDGRAETTSADPLSTRASRGETVAPRVESTRPQFGRGPVPERVAPTPIPALRAPDGVAADGRAPALPTIAFALLGLMGMAALVALLWRRRGGRSAPVVARPMPFPPDVLIEAELQEIVAEERHRLLRDEHEHELPETGEPIRAGPP